MAEKGISNRWSLPRPGGLAASTVECQAIESFSLGPVQASSLFAEMVAASCDAHEREVRASGGTRQSLRIYARAAQPGLDGSGVEYGQIIKFSPAPPSKLTCSVCFHTSELLATAYPRYLVGRRSRAIDHTDIGIRAPIALLRQTIHSRSTNPSIPSYSDVYPCWLACRTAINCNC